MVFKNNKLDSSGILKEVKQKNNLSAPNSLKFIDTYQITVTIPSSCQAHYAKTRQQQLQKMRTMLNIGLMGHQECIFQS